MTETLHIYTRVSTTSQEEEGTSLETQLEQGIERSTKLGFTHRHWDEGGRSSSKDDLGNRPVLTELMGEIDEGNVKHLYVWNTDRLSRNLQTWGMIRLKLIQNEVTLHTPTGEQVLSDPTTNLMLGIMSEISTYDNQLRTERFRLGKLKRIREGGWMGGPPPFGYHLTDSRLEPDEDESKWVRFIFESYSEGHSVDQIRTDLMNNGIETRRGNPVWSHGSIEKVLRNPHYGGYYHYHDKKSGETLRVNCPSILKPSLIKKVQDVREQRSYRKGGTKRNRTSNQKHVYLLSDLLVCGHCGSKYGGNYKKTQTSYYQCSQKTHRYRTKDTKDHFECSSRRNIRIDRTDELVWDTVLDVITNSHGFMETVKSEVLEGRSLRKSTSDLKKLRTRMRKIDRDIDQVSDSIVNLNTEKLIGTSDKRDFEKILVNLEKKRLDLEVEKEGLVREERLEERNKHWIDWMKEFGKKVDNLRDSDLPIEDRKRFLNGILKDIEVKSLDTQKHQLDIRFRFPYVGDKLIYDTPQTKSDGYTIKGGQKSKKVRSDLLKKSKV